MTQNIEKEIYDIISGLSPSLQDYALDKLQTIKTSQDITIQSQPPPPKPPDEKTA